MSRRPRLYFSFRSPFSWMLVHRLGQELDALHDEVELIPYWDPDRATEESLAERGATFHYVQMSRAKHRYILGDTKRVAARLGLAMRWPVDVDPWWEVPHLAYLAARRLGREEELYGALVAARWERGEDICDPGVVHAIGTSLGIGGDLLVGATSDEDIRREGVGCLERAYRDDVFGVPYIIAGRQRFWGLDRLAWFLAHHRGGAVPDEHLEGLALLTGSYDLDTAGGCG
jgi:2-hydroxychromene-2-carboxylate isomerase